MTDRQAASNLPISLVIADFKDELLVVDGFGWWQQGLYLGQHRCNGCFSCCRTGPWWKSSHHWRTGCNLLWTINDKIFVPRSTLRDLWLLVWRCLVALTLDKNPKSSLMAFLTVQSLTFHCLKRVVRLATMDLLRPAKNLGVHFNSVMISPHRAALPTTSSLEMKYLGFSVYLGCTGACQWLLVWYWVVLSSYWVVLEHKL